MQTEYRIDYQPFDFSTGANNIHVQRLDGDKWVTVWSTNEMSNDYAYSEAKDKLNALRKNNDT